MADNEIPLPQVVITDGDSSVIKGLDKYMGVQQQRCVWHLNGNMVKAIKKRWRKYENPVPNSAGDNGENNESAEAVREDLKEVHRLHAKPGTNTRTVRETLGDLPGSIALMRTSFFFLWKHIVFARTVEDHERALALMRRQFGKGQPALMEYIDNERLPHIEEWAYCYTRRYCNYSFVLTSPNEATNGSAKSQGMTCRNGFLILFETMNRYIDSHIKANRHKVRKATGKVRLDYLGREWLGGVELGLSLWALDLLYHQHMKLLGTTPAPNRPHRDLGQCLGSFTAQYGLPCTHRMSERREAGEVGLVDPASCAPFWRLRQSRDATDPYLNLIVPKKAVPKGRPPLNSGPFGKEPILPGGKPVTSRRKSGAHKSSAPVNKQVASRSNPTKSRAVRPATKRPIAGRTKTGIKSSARRIASAHECIDLASEDASNQREGAVRRKLTVQEGTGQRRAAKVQERIKRSARPFAEQQDLPQDETPTSGDCIVARGSDPVHSTDRSGDSDEPSSSEYSDETESYGGER
ncbi:hypothetical protein OQA88_13699 [Cercophora sp. LCS_1]